MTIDINAWIILLVYQTLTFDAFHHQRILPVIITLQFQSSNVYPSFNYDVIYRGEKEKSAAKYWLRTYSTNSRKCFCHTIRYHCLGQPMSFKNGHSWSLVHSFRILITVNRRKRKIKQSMIRNFFPKLPHTEQEVTKSKRGERRK